MVLVYYLIRHPRDIKVSALLILGTVLILLAGTSIHPQGQGNILSRIRTFAHLEADPSAVGRFLYYQAALEGIKEFPVTGIGFENFRTLYPRYRQPLDNEIFSNTIPTMVHNGYLQTALTNGIPALLLYLLFLSSIVFFILKALRKAPSEKEKTLQSTFLASITGYLVQDFVGWLDVGLLPFFGPCSDSRLLSPMQPVRGRLFPKKGALSVMCCSPS